MQNSSRHLSDIKPGQYLWLKPNCAGTLPFGSLQDILIEPPPPHIDVEIWHPAVDLNVRNSPKRLLYHSYWHGGQEHDRQTVQWSWKGPVETSVPQSVPWFNGSLSILILPSISVTIVLFALKTIIWYPAVGLRSRFPLKSAKGLGNTFDLSLKCERFFLLGVLQDILMEYPPLSKNTLDGQLWTWGSESHTYTYVNWGTG